MKRGLLFATALMGLALAGTPAPAQPVDASAGGTLGIEALFNTQDDAFVTLLAASGAAVTASGGSGSGFGCVRVERDGLVDMGCGSLTVSVAEDLSSGTVTGSIPTKVYASGPVEIGPSNVQINVTLSATGTALPGGTYIFNGHPGPSAYGHTAAAFRWSAASGTVTSDVVGGGAFSSDFQRLFRGLYHWFAQTA